MPSFHYSKTSSFYPQPQKPTLRILINRRRRELGLGFTLLELLVVITIITILAGLVFGAIWNAERTAKINKTRNLITRLDLVVRQVYEDAAKYGRLSLPPNSASNPQQGVLIVTQARYDHLRMMLPERFSDITEDPYPYMWETVENQKRRLPAKVLRYRSLLKAHPPKGDYDGAECLYMIVMSQGSEVVEQFKAHDSGDADYDGLREFQDAWGNPIAFLRWAPGYTSDIQTETITDVCTNCKAPWEPTNQPTCHHCGCPIKELCKVYQHDPLDSWRLYKPPADGSNPRRGCMLMPLVYSAGPDGGYDINVGKSSTPYWTGDPWTRPGTNPGTEIPNNAGEPIDSDNVSITNPDIADGGIDSYDNIANH